MMLEELERRNYSASTTHCYLSLMPYPKKARRLPSVRTPVA